MTVTAWKTPATPEAESVPPLCPDCRHCLERVRLLDGSIRPVCILPRWGSPQLAWQARYEFGCGWNGDFFEPRPPSPAGPAAPASRR